MRCTTCHNGDLREERRHKSEEKDGRVAVVTDIPVTVCPSCEAVWYAADVAIALDAIFPQMLAVEVFAVRPFTAQGPASPERETEDGSFA